MKHKIGVFSSKSSEQLLEVTRKSDGKKQNLQLTPAEPSGYLF